MVTNEETAVIVAPKDNFPEKSSPDSTIHASSTDRAGNTSIVPEKPSEDGYNWRKYGQKNVKGNGNIRSYYKCSHPVCQVKKQVERSQDGRITDVIYLGNHEHVSLHSDPQTAIPFPLSVRVPDSAPGAADKDKPSDVPYSATDHVEKLIVGELAIVKATDGTTLAPVTPLSQTRNDHGENLTLKKRKRSVDGADSSEKSNHESRVVVHTVSEVDMVNDGYRWRKYGQKMVKGSPNPRSYYRCSTAGCPVKKHVERASHDFKVVITTYEGQHDHSMPPVRTIVPQAPGASVGGIEPNGSSKSKSEEGDTQKSISVYLAPNIKEENNLAIVVKTDDPISRSTDQEASQAEKTDFIAQTAKEEKVQSSELDKVPETVSTETKPSIELDLKPETVSIEAKRPDAIIEKSNGLQMPNAEAVKVPETVSTDTKPSIELDLKPETVSIEAKRPDAIIEKSNGLQMPNAEVIA